MYQNEALAVAEELSIATISRNEYLKPQKEYQRLREPIPKAARKRREPTRYPDFEWTGDRIELLKELWAEGVSASQIAPRLGTTRNAVIGKVDRLGLSGRAVTVRTPRQHKPRAPRKFRTERQIAHHAAMMGAFRTPRAISLPVPPPPPPEADVAGILLLSDHRSCKYQDRNGKWCGVETPFGKSFCVYHETIVYYRPTKSCRRAA